MLDDNMKYITRRVNHLRMYTGKNKKQRVKRAGSAFILPFQTFFKKFVSGRLRQTDRQTNSCVYLIPNAKTYLGEFVYYYRYQYISPHAHVLDGACDGKTTNYYCTSLLCTILPPLSTISLFPRCDTA